MKQDRASFSGEYGAVVVMVGANNMGYRGMETVISHIAEIASLLQEYNPKSHIFVCEVGSIKFANTNLVYLMF